MMQNPSTLEQVLHFFSNVLNKAYVEKDSNGSLFHDGAEILVGASSGYSSHLRKASNEGLKDVRT